MKSVVIRQNKQLDQNTPKYAIIQRNKLSANYLTISPHNTIKYHIEVGQKYWESIFRAEGITDRRLQQERIVREKQSILDFLTGAENSGKAWFSTFYITPDGKE
ncbi:MAG: hypothetical protein NC548_49220, partial [Lachnospiraceae bacterium]|nr:hypothetical protein [Lachnospiraceae bacterium]